MNQNKTTEEAPQSKEITCPICGKTFITDLNHRYVCNLCLEKRNNKNIRAMLQALEDLGWGEHLIDSRWKNEIINLIQVHFNNTMPMIDIYALLEVVLI